MQRVLVTGASGFIGRHCVPLLQGCEGEVHVIRHHRSVPSTPGIVSHSMDLFDEAKTTKLLARIRATHLLHLAWIVTPGEFWSSPENHRWVQASTSLVRSFAANGGRRIVAAGTCAEYDWSAGTCHEVQTPLTPTTPYGQAKRAFHQVLERVCEEWELSMAWGRIFMLYGPHEYPQRFVASVLNALLTNQSAFCSEGHEQRDLLHVEDVADAFVRLLRSDVEGPINIASGETITLRAVATRLAEMVRRSDLVRYGARASPSGEPQRIAADVTRLRTELHWTPRYSLARGLVHTLQWWKQRLEEERASRNGSRVDTRN